jgi:hypothetical protein
MAKRNKLFLFSNFYINIIFFVYLFKKEWDQIKGSSKASAGATLRKL